MSKVLLLSSDIVGNTMAGPAIRYWEMANSLCKEHQVTLVTPNRCPLKSEKFDVKALQEISLKEETLKHDFVITQQIHPSISLKMKDHGTRLILDLYDPIPLEALEIFKEENLFSRTLHNKHQVNKQNTLLRLADAYICANRPQLHMWMGALMSQRCLTPHKYDSDPTFNQYIQTVPFGLSSTPPQRTGPGIRERYNLKPTDKIILWGGGIWNWFDPLTLIEAVHDIRQRHPEVYLVFMGIKHPNPGVPKMSMSVKAVELAKQLGSGVFFNYDWVPYEERANFLLDADIGASIHSKHLETTFAFRTRILDYIWAELPIIATEGDSFAELIEKENLGIVVPYQDRVALAKAIEKILFETHGTVKTNLARIKPTFYWEEVVKPLNRMMLFLKKQKQKPLSIFDKIAIRSRSFLTFLYRVINFLRKIWTLLH